MKLFNRTTGWLALLALAIAFPFLANNDYYLTVMSTAYIFALATLGLNLITGYTGQYNLAHSGFMAVGAYTVGILTVDYQVPFWVAFALSGFVAAAIGFFVGILSLRLKGHFFAIFTLCIGYIMYLLVEKWESLTHGTVGIIGIPAPGPIGGIEFDTPITLYYLVLVVLAISIWAMQRIVSSLLGRSFIAVRNSEELAEALGINLMRTKVLAFMLSVFYAGIAGGLYAGFVRFLGPGIAGVEHTFDMTIYMLIGGLGTVLGPLLGSVAMPWLTQYLQFLQDYRFIVFGPLLIVLIIFLPNGIVGTYLTWRARRQSRTAAALLARTQSKSGASTATSVNQEGGSHA
ncbi:MAG: branched-chain amino acid ABC transporter permease [Herbaspirillum sp.]